MASARSLCMTAAAAIGLLSAASAQAQQSMQVGRLVYPYAPGGVGDASARILAELLGSRMGRQFIVENRSGASGMAGTRSVVQARPDGNTLIYATVAILSVYPTLYAKLGYDPQRDFAPVAQVAEFDFAMAIGRHIDARTVSEFVSWARSNPDKANYATPGAGSLPHFAAVSIASATGIKLQHVHYAGGPPAVSDVVAGHLPMAVVATSDVVELHKSGQLAILATSGRRRSFQAPDAPTFRELGYDVEGYGWFGLLAPARTSNSTIERLNAVVVTALAEPEVRAKFLALGLEPTGSSPQGLADTIRADRDKWARTIKDSGFTPTD